MLNESKKNKYKSPSRIFEKPNSHYYSGVLSRLSVFISILKDKYQGLDTFVELKNYLNSEHSPIEFKLIFYYSIFFEAKSLIVFFEGMPKEDQQMEIEYQKNLKLNSNKYANKKIYDFNNLVSELKTIEKEFIKFEKENKEKIEQVLDLELKYKISYWQGFLSEVALQSYLDESDPGEYMNSKKDFCHERTEIEYFRLFIYWLGKTDISRLEKIPFFGEFEKRLKIMDIYFKLKLGGPTKLRFYNDPSFWWLDAEYNYPENTVVKDMLPDEVSQMPIIDENIFNIKSHNGPIKTKNKFEFSEEIKNLFSVPEGLPKDFFENFKDWAKLIRKNNYGY